MIRLADSYVRVINLNFCTPCISSYKNEIRLAFAVQLYRSGRTQQKAKVVGSKFDRTRSPARASKQKQSPNVPRQFRRNLAKSSRLLVHLCSIFRAISPSVKGVKVLFLSGQQQPPAVFATSVLLAPTPTLWLRLHSSPTATARNSPPPSLSTKCYVLDAAYGHEETIEPNQGWISVYVSPFFSFIST